MNKGKSTSTGAHPEEEFKVIGGRNEVCDIFEISFDGEQKTLRRNWDERDGWVRAERYDDRPSFFQLAKAACLALLSFMLILRSFSRPFSTSLSRAFPRHIPAGPTAQGDGDIPASLEQAAQTEGLTAEDFKEANEGKRVQWTLDDIVENDNDSSSAGHLYLAQQRQNLHYLRLIEHEMPKLVGECSLLARTFRLSDNPQTQPFANRSFLQRQKRRSLSGPCLMAVKSIPPR